MGVLQRVISQILTRLRDVNASQRTALLLGGVLVAVSLIWLVQWAASPELVPLLDQDLSSEELASVRSGLDAMGEEYEVRGNRVFVPSGAAQSSIIARLEQDGRMPADTSMGFAALIEKSDPWISQEENNRRWTYALKNEIEGVLAKFQGVQSASVLLNLATAPRGFSKMPPRNSASVTLVMKNGDQVPTALAQAAARLVAGAVAGLTVRDVQVVDASGRIALDWESEQDPANALERLRRKHERDFTEKVRRQIADPKALVSVVVELDSTARNTQRETPIKGPARIDETTSDAMSRVQRSEQPGVQPNVGIAAGGGGADETRTQETTKTEFEHGKELATEATPAGDIKSVTAAVSLSSSYLEAVYRHKTPNAELPAPFEKIEEVFLGERTRLLPQVARLISPPDSKNVDITWHYDTPIATTDVVAMGTLDQSFDLAKRYGAQSGLALLALLSLGMMLRMARRPDEGEAFGLELGLPKEAIEAARQAAQDIGSMSAAAAAQAERRGGRRGGGRGGRAGAGGADLTDDVEQAAATEGMLVAQEVDPGAVQTRKMLDQVAEMTDADPEVVSTLVEHWVQKNEGYHEGND